MRPAASTLLVCLAALAVGCGDEDEPSAGSTTSAEVTAETASTSTSTSPEASPPPGESVAQPPARDGSGPEWVVRAVLTGSEPATRTCHQLVTEHYVEVSYGSRQGCLAAQQPGAFASDVKFVGRPALDPDDASRLHVTAIPEGGPYDGIEVEVELVLGPPPAGYRLDSLVADVPAGP